ncbi:hypothetical protein [Sulfurimonas sp. CS5]|uniref:hypothetical protein n=1 Tax=Sulfurimonas sp. CS5 TaxID=3391145 RepID=UPI0039E83A07
MNDFQLKLILSILSGVVFSFVFILLAFALPIDNKSQLNVKKPKGMLEKVSHSARK